MQITALQLAKRWIGTKEIAGLVANPAIATMLRMVGQVGSDEIPWCSAFVNFIAWQLGLPATAKANARSWLHVGTPVKLPDAKPGFDVVVFNRANGNPDPNVEGPGHVAFYCSTNGDRVNVFGGNQGNSVSLASFPTRSILGIRRLADG